MSRMSDLDILVQNLSEGYDLPRHVVVGIVNQVLSFVGNESEDEAEEREDNFRDDVEADADTLASIGWGTDEDYGYYGEENY